MAKEIKGPTDQLGESFFYHYKDVHLCRLKLIEEVSDTQLVYLVTDNAFNFTKDPNEWVNTRLVFRLSDSGDGTLMEFEHEGLTPKDECFGVCNDAWTSYIQGSLKNYIETGTGQPNEKEGGLNAKLVEKWGLPNK